MDAERDKVFADFQAGADRAFNSFSDSIDREFTKFLQESWQQFNLVYQPKPDNKPKPVIHPTPAGFEKPVDREIKHSTTNTPEPDFISKDDFTNRLNDEFKVKLNDYIKTSPEKRQFNYQGISINFFFDSKIDFNFSGKPDNRKIADAWAGLSTHDLSTPIDQLAYYATRMKVNDWGLALIMKSASKQVFPESNIKQNILTWYMLNKVGYKLRLAYDESNVYLLVPSAMNIYGVGYFIFDGIRYYLLDIDNGIGKPQKISTYNKDYNPEGGVIDFLQTSSPTFGKFFKTRKFSFPIDGSNVNLEVVFDSSEISYYSQFPFLDLHALFASSLSDTSFATISAGLQPFLQSKTELRKVNVLLSFLQHGFNYKVDDDQFGYENYLYPVETLFYPYSDCEDRAFLFAFLVKRLLHLEVVGLDFPGHVATAVKFSEPVIGDYIDVEGEKYLICDPTYIGASAGMCMPQYKQSDLKIIKTPIINNN